MEDTRSVNTPDVAEKVDTVVLAENPDATAEGDPVARPAENVPDAPTQPQLTPEQLAALALKNQTIDEFLKSLGFFMIVQFARPDSVVARVIYSDIAPYPPAIIAVLEGILRDHKLREEIDSSSEIMEQAAKTAQAEISEKAQKKNVRDRILGRR
jgi:hypothetical protein